ncbi:MAG: hypothetical protein EZS28_052713, partial [Streblomastix strix]
GSQEKILPILTIIAQKLRESLTGINKSSPEAFSAILDVLILLSQNVGENLTQFYQQFLAPIGSVLMKTGGPVVSKGGKSVDVKAKCLEALQCLDENGGEGAYAIIHKKIPTYAR